MGVLPGKLVYATFCDRRGRHWFSNSALSDVFPNGCESHEWMIRFDRDFHFGPYVVYVDRHLNCRATTAEGAYRVLRDHGLTLRTNAGSLERD